MRHLTYPKIPAAQQLGSVRTGGDWVATEKIHGAQLVVATDRSTGGSTGGLRVGKRKAWLNGGEPFFGWQLLRGAFEAAVAALHSGAAAVRIYGELYGGHYPHPGVPPVPGAAPVQTGVWYSPGIRFALFDVLDHADPGDDGVFRTYAGVAAVAAAAGLDVVPLLGRGTRTSLDALPTRFPSRVPEMLGLPAVQDNLAEGMVLRPDAALAPQDRPIVKVKIDEFDEQRFDESRPWDRHARVPAADLERIAVGLVNAARIASARSKVGPVPSPELADEVVLDVLVDLGEAYPAATAALTAAEQTTVEDALRRAVAAHG